MEFLHASIALLASMVLILAGMVGWLYYQQTKLFQNMNSIVMVIGELARPPTISFAHSEPVPEDEVIPESEIVADVKNVLEDDDRVSVEAEHSISEMPADIVSGGPEPIDTDGLEEKSAKELKEMLSKRGIPYGKRDNKNSLITLLKATA